MDNDYLARLKREIAREQEAMPAFIKAIEKAVDDARPIWHLGDGNGGALIDAFMRVLEQRGAYRKPADDGASRREKIDASMRKTVMERDKYRCVMCGTHIDLTIDHIVPLAKGGGTDVQNLQTLCRRCNSSKGAKYIGGRP
jgi:hypothetical protein